MYLNLRARWHYSPSPTGGILRQSADHLQKNVVDAQLQMMSNVPRPSGWLTQPRVIVAFIEDLIQANYWRSRKGRIALVEASNPHLATDIRYITGQFIALKCRGIFRGLLRLLSGDEDKAEKCALQAGSYNQSNENVILSTEVKRQTRAPSFMLPRKVGAFDQ